MLRPTLNNSALKPTRLVPKPSQMPPARRKLPRVRLGRPGRHLRRHNRLLRPHLKIKNPGMRAAAKSQGMIPIPATAGRESNPNNYSAGAQPHIMRGVIKGQRRPFKNPCYMLQDQDELLRARPVVFV
jgi:hypothetical protein